MRKGTIKRMCCGLLVVLLVVCASPIAYSRGVDRSRLRLENDIGHTVLFTFADMQMQGKLAKQSPLSEEELQQLIDKTLKEMGLTEEEVGKMHDELEKAQRDGELTQEEIDQFKEDLKTMFDLAGLGSVVDVLEILAPDGDTLGGLGNIAMDKAKDRAQKIATDSFSDVAKELVKKGLKAVDVAKALDVIQRAMTKDREKWDNRIKASALKAELNEIYSRLQQAIDKAKKDKDSKWQIRFKQATAQRRNFSFFGVEANSQVWTLDMILEQTESTGEFSFDSKNVAGTAAGTYEGRYTMTIDSDLIGFASRPQDAARQIGIHGQVIEELEQYVLSSPYSFDLHADGRGEAKNQRVITGTCSVYILSSGQMQMELVEERDEVHNEFNDIKIKFTSSASAQGFTIDLTQWGNIKAKRDEKLVYIDYPEYSTEYWNGEERPREGNGWIPPNDEFGVAQYSGPQNGGWDDSDIWIPWDDPMKEMRIVR